MLFVILNDIRTQMIKCHFSRLIGERKVRIADVALATGLHRNMLTLLYKETAVRVELEAIDKLCRYFTVPVGELLEFTDSSPVPALQSGNPR